MANVNTPNGFTPIRMQDGSNIPTKDFPVGTGNGTALFVGDAVEIASTGTVQKIATSGTNPTRVIGVITAIYDSNETPAGHPNGDISQKYLPASTAGIVTLALALPTAIFKIQAQTGTAVAETDRFGMADIVLGAGDTVTARSRHVLNASGIGTGSAQLAIIDKIDDPNNAWGDAVDLEVFFNESFFNGAVAGV